jgi:hypothetical protein
VEDKRDMAIIKICGVLIDILVQIAPNVYKSYIMTDKKGQNSYWYSARMPYMVQWLQAYCTIANSPRVWRVSDLRSTHTSDPCVVNKIVHGTQMTICFHVDDYKLSHRSSRANDNMIDCLRQEYKHIFEDGSGEMTVTRKVR